MLRHWRLAGGGLLLLGLAVSAFRSESRMEGTIQQVVYGDSGLSGFALGNHAFIRLSSCSLNHAQAFRPGVSVTVTGTQVASTPNQVVNPTQLAAGGSTIDLSNSQPCPPKEVVGLAQLRSAHERAPLFSANVGDDGRVEQLVLQGDPGQPGVVIQIPHDGTISPNALKLGYMIESDGVALETAPEKLVVAMHVTTAQTGGELLKPADRPGVPQGAHWAVKDGEIKRLLLTPAGQVNGVLLGDQTALRFPPANSEQARLLIPGTRVKASGPESGSQVRTQYLLFPSREWVLEFPKQGRIAARPENPTLAGPYGIVPQNAEQIAEQKPHSGAALAPSGPLQKIDEKSSIETMLKDPDGRVEAIVLSNGATATIPPDLRSGVASKLSPGDRVSISGMGGHYRQGTALEAQSIEKIS